MKELRPGSTGRTEVRVLSAFDKKRKAILLVGGDKSTDWTGWYTRNIQVADDRLDEHQAALAAEKTAGRRSGRKSSSSKGKGRR
jgi:hypothetical protein